MAVPDSLPARDWVSLIQPMTDLQRGVTHRPVSITHGEGVRGFDVARAPLD